MYCSTNQRHVAEISISVVSVSRLMASSSLQVPKIVKSGYVNFQSHHPLLSVNIVIRGMKGDDERGKKETRRERKLISRSGISKLVESELSSQATCKKSIRSISPEMVDSSFLDLEIRVLESGILRKEPVYLI